MRWIASLVAEAHRILMRGGVFLYPRDTKDPARPGRLRLLYEANPIAMHRRAGRRRASTGRRSISGVEPVALHQRIGLVFGSRDEVERIERYHREPDRTSRRRRCRQRRCSGRVGTSTDRSRVSHAIARLPGAGLRTPVMSCRRKAPMSL